MMRLTRIWLVLLALVGSTALAGSAPVILESGTSPGTVTPGASFTLYANVADPDGLEDLLAVGILAEDQLVTLLEQTAPGRYEATFTAPVDMPVGVWPLTAAAVDKDLNVGELSPFLFATQGSEGVQLLAPPDGAVIGQEGPGAFAWSPFPGAILYAFQLHTPLGISATILLPEVVTELPVPPELWSMIPDGEYFWRVGVVRYDEGLEPEAWSPLWGFVKDAGQGPGPGDHVAGVVLEVLPAEMQLVVGAHPGQGPGGEEVLVQASPETLILGPEGELTFEEILPGDFLLAEGTWQDDLFLAEVIHLDRGPGPGDHVAGFIQEIDLAAGTLTLGHRDPGHQGDEVVVQVVPETLITNPWGDVLALEELQIGWHAHADGSWDDEVFLAEFVLVDDGGGPGPVDEVFGEITQILPEAMQIVLGSPRDGGADDLLVQVTPETLIMSFCGELLVFEDLEVGQLLQGFGVWEGEVFTAFELYVDRGGPGPGDQIHGVIADILPGEMQIVLDRGWGGPGGGPALVQITADTLLMTTTGDLIEFADLEIGQFAMAHGEWQGDLLVAFEVVVDSGPGPGGDLHGFILDILPAEMQIVLEACWGGNCEDDALVQITVDTLLMTTAGDIIEFADLEIGQFAMAHGEWQGDLLVAFEVMIEVGPGPGGTVTGEILELDPAVLQITLGGHGAALVVQILPHTLILDEQGLPLVFEDLQPGMMLVAEGVWDGDLFLAEIVMVHGQGPGPGDAFDGFVMEIDEVAMTLLLGTYGWPEDPLLVQVAPGTMIHDFEGMPMSFQEIVVDAAIHVLGHWQGELFVADEIIVWR